MTQIDLSRIDLAEFNPAARTRPSALASLKADISEVGVLSPIHLLPRGERFIIADGHRRFTIVRELGKDRKIQAVIHDEKENIVELWARLNRSTRKIDGKEWLAMWLAVGKQSEPLLPNQVRGQIRACAEIFGGREGVESVMCDPETNLPIASPAIVQLIDRVNMQFQEKQSIFNNRSTGAKYHRPTKKEIGQWIIRHKAAHMVSAVLGRSGVAPLGLLRKLSSRIRKDAPFTQADLVSRTSNGD